MRHSFRVCDNARTFYRLKLRYNQRVKSARKRLLIIQFLQLGPQVLWQLNMYITNIKTEFLLGPQKSAIDQPLAVLWLNIICVNRIIMKNHK